jgi:hypothetical protein
MTQHDRDMLLKAADGVAKHKDLTGLAAIIRRIGERQEVTDGEVPEGMVRVRAAVAVDSTGRWEAAGYHGWQETTTPELLNESREFANRSLHWITANVPIPVPQTITAAVE